MKVIQAIHEPAKYEEQDEDRKKCRDYSGEHLGERVLLNVLKGVKGYCTVSAHQLALSVLYRYYTVL